MDEGLLLEVEIVLSLEQNKIKSPLWYEGFDKMIIMRFFSVLSSSFVENHRSIRKQSRKENHQSKKRKGGNWLVQVLIDKIMAPTMILLCYQHEYTVLRVHAPQPTVGFFLQVAPMIEDGNILIDEPPSTVSTISTTGLPIPMTQKHVMMARYSSSFRSFQVFLGLWWGLVMSGWIWRTKQKFPVG
mmetsp:Transcript_60324/g.148027  ORF Transcript_60324/g.148027 Transcript_60324/m.148027 type:complete len:186 (-) Transcript_60324:22-579(-)